MPGSRTALFSRRQAGGVFTLSDLDRHPGDIYFVCSVNGTDAAGNGANPDAPFATIDYAIGNCTASKGDVIYVLPGHAESIAAAAAIAADVAGISIIGLGNGANRPTITWHTTDATFAISAANVKVQNIRCTIDVDAVVKLFTISGAGATLDTVDFIEGTSVAALQFALVTGTDCTIKNSTWIQKTTAATALAQWIVYTAAHGLKIQNNYLWLKGYASSNPANGAVVGATTASTGILIASNVFVVVNSTGNVVISCLASDAGYICDNYVGTSKTATAGSIVPQSCYCSQNFAANEVAKQGFLEPAADSN